MLLSGLRLRAPSYIGPDGGMADAEGLNPSALNGACGFESHSGHITKRPTGAIPPFRFLEVNDARLLTDNDLSAPG